MTPASLQVNYREELKKCGDELYLKNQHWEFISIITDPTLLEPLSHALSLSVEFIKKNGGAWFVNTTNTPNYNSLSGENQRILNAQLNKMIENKYTFINYNGLRQQKFNILTRNNTINFFSNKVVIIDEAHNFVSRQLLIN